MTFPNLYMQFSSIRERYAVIILNIILFVLQFDTFTFVREGGMGFLSPFRIIVLPLCVYYFISWNNRLNKSDLHKFILTALFFIFCILGDLLSQISNLGSMIGNIVMLYFSFFWFKKNTIRRSTLYIITTWCAIQIPVFISLLLSGGIGIGERFKGLHFDPNYLCAYVIPAIWASIYLLKDEKRKYLRLYNLSIIFSGILIVLLSFSRGGLLALLATGFVYFFSYYRKIAIILIIGVCLGASYMLSIAPYVDYSDASTSFFLGFVYRNFSSVDDINELTSGRSDLIAAFIEEISKGNYIVFGASLPQYMHDVNDGFNSHNGFVDLCAQGGLIIGGVFSLLLLLSCIQIFILAIRYNKISYEYLLALSLLLPLLFLSFEAKISWLVFGLIISMSNKSIYKRMISIPKI